MTDRIKWGDPVTGWDGVIAAAQGLRDRKIVQCWKSESWYSWGKADHLSAADKYRIGEKMKPREFWVNVYPGDQSDTLAHATQELADSVASQDRIKCIRVREVIE